MQKQSFIDNIEKSFAEPLIWIEKAMKPLTLEEIWFKPNENSNSIGILCKHLSGNITQYIISCLGQKEDQRKRVLEFENYQIDQPLALLQKTINEAQTIIQKVDDLEKLYEVQGVSLSGLEILQHVTQHLYYHAGQIVLLSKMIANIDLNLYEGRDLNLLNPKP